MAGKTSYTKEDVKKIIEELLKPDNDIKKISKQLGYTYSLVNSINKLRTAYLEEGEAEINVPVGKDIKTWVKEICEELSKETVLGLQDENNDSETDKSDDPNKKLKEKIIEGIKSINHISVEAKQKTTPDTYNKDIVDILKEEGNVADLIKMAKKRKSNNSTTIAYVRYGGDKDYYRKILNAILYIDENSEFAINNLAVSYCDDGDYGQAEKLSRKMAYKDGVQTNVKLHSRAILAKILAGKMIAQKTNDDVEELCRLAGTVLNSTSSIESDRKLVSEVIELFENEFGKLEIAEDSKKESEKIEIIIPNYNYIMELLSQAPDFQTYAHLNLLAGKVEGLSELLEHCKTQLKLIFDELNEVIEKLEISTENQEIDIIEEQIPNTEVKIDVIESNIEKEEESEWLPSDVSKENEERLSEEEIRNICKENLINAYTEAESQNPNQDYIIECIKKALELQPEGAYVRRYIAKLYGNKQYDLAGKLDELIFSKNSNDIRAAKSVAKQYLFKKYDGKLSSKTINAYLDVISNEDIPRFVKLIKGNDGNIDKVLEIMGGYEHILEYTQNNHIISYKEFTKNNMFDKVSVSPACDKIRKRLQEGEVVYVNEIDNLKNIGKLRRQLLYIEICVYSGELGKGMLKKIKANLARPDCGFLKEDIEVLEAALKLSESKQKRDIISRKENFDNLYIKVNKIVNKSENEKKEIVKDKKLEDDGEGYPDI